MNRRDLLKNLGFLTTSVAVFGLPGCGGSDDDDLPAGAAGDILSQPGTAGTYRFPQGVMSADPKPGSIILWTRAVPAANHDVTQTGAGEPDFEVRLEVSATADFKVLVANEALTAKAANDNSLRHRLTGLDAASTYYYRFKAGTGVSRIGRFKTAPADNADVSELNFAFVSCQDWSVNHWAGLSALAKQDMDFLVHLGDYIYEAAGDSYQAEGVESAHDALVIPSNTLKPGSTTARVATTLEDYRYLYKKYRTDPRLQELHARCAIIAVWDDHEFSDDCWQNNQTYSNGTVKLLNGVLPVSKEQLGEPSAPEADTRQTDRRRAANRAWFEFMPADIPDLNESAAGNFATVQIYRDLKFGKLAHLVMTDERLYRADHVLPEATPNPANGEPLGSIGARYFVPEPTFLQLQGGKMQAALGMAAQAAAGAGDLATAGFLQGIVVKLTADPTGSTLTANEVATLYDTGLGLVSILGKTQRDWWKGKMAGSTATWKFWGNEVSLLRMALNLNALPAIVAQANALAAAGNPALKAMLNTYLVNADQWDGYAAERQALTGFLKGAGVKNVVALTGDIHAFYAGEVPANYGAYTPGDAALVDLVTAGISSSSFWSYLADVVGSFEAEVKAVKAQRAADPFSYTNTLETSANPFRALRPLVYSSVNMLVYQAVRTEVVKQITTALPTGSIDVGTPAGQIAFETLTAKQKTDINRLAFEEYLKNETADGHTPVNTLNETLAGDMGGTLLAMINGLLAKQGKPATTTNPYTGTDAAPARQNPWIRYVQTGTQGFATVKVTPAKVEARFHHITPLLRSGGSATAPSADAAVALVKTVTVNKDSTALTIG